MSSHCTFCTQPQTPSLKFEGCSHSSCSLCMKNIIFYSHLRKFEAGDIIEIECPLCNAGKTSLSLNDVTNIAKKQYSTNGYYCVTHGCPANSYCETCKKFICLLCSKEHSDKQLSHSIKKDVKGVQYKPSGSNLKIPFKYKDFRDYSDHLSSSLSHFEKKVGDYERTVTGKLDDMIKKLDEYKKEFLAQMQEAVNREKKIVEIFKMFYESFYTDLSHTINKKDYAYLENLCNSMERQFSSITLSNTEILKEDLESLNEQIEGYLGSMTPPKIKYCFPAIARTYANSKTLTGHSDKINCVALLPNGDIASGGRDSVIRIWKKSANYENTQNLEGHKQWITNLLVLNNGQLLSGAYDGNTKVWNPSNNYENIQTLTGHTNWISASFQFSSGNIVTASFDNSIIVRNKNYKIIDNLKDHTFGVFALQALPNNKFASGSGDKTIKIWNKELRVDITLKGHNSSVSCLAFLPEENYLASGSNDKTIKIWDYNSGECINTIKAHGDGVSCFSVLPDGRLVSGAEDNLIKIWDNENNYNCTHILKGHSNVVNAVMLLEDKQLLSASADKIMKIWTEERNIFS